VCQPDTSDRAADEFHQRFTGGERGDGHAPADDLAQAGDVGGDLKDGLHAPPCHAEARHDLVENEQTAVLVAELPQALKKAGLWRDIAHVARERLDDDGSDAAAMI